MIHASESGHWYDRAGNPVYTVLGRNGEPRPVTLRDARRLNLVPGVSGVMSCAAKPGLIRWQLNQAVLAAMTLPRNPDEEDEAYITRILRDSQEQARKAADRGTAIHAAIQGYYEGEPPRDSDLLPYVRAVASSVSGWIDSPHRFIPERSFAHALGYGGKVDLHNPVAILDFKSKEFSDTSKKLAWDEHCVQLAAYRKGLRYPKARCANVFVSVNKPGLVHIHEWAEEELAMGWKKFEALLAYWKADRSYESGWELEAA